MKNKVAQAEILTAGAAQTDITPPKGTRLGSDFFSHYARFIHDPLFSKALVLKKGTTTFALVMVDICIMPSDFLDNVKNKIESATGLKKENILLASTHTHGAGDVVGLLGGAVDIAYRTRLPDLIVSSVVAALKKIKPAKIASGSTTLTGYSVCRRYFMKDGFKASNPVTHGLDAVKTNPYGAVEQIVKPTATVDSDVRFLAVKGMDDSWISVVGNYNSHYAGDWDVDTVTADFYGSFAKHLTQNIDADNDFVAILSYGTGGDVNTWDFRDPDKFPKDEFAKTEMMGRDLADAVHNQFETLDWSENAELKIAYEELYLNLRKPDAEEIQTAERQLSVHNFEDLKLDEHGIAMVYVREQLLLNEYPNIHTSAVQAIRIGNQIIGASGGELFTETGRWLKENSKGHNYFTICLANSYDGYVPPIHELDKGGYETWRARSSFLDKTAEGKIKNALLALITKVS